MKKPGSVFAVLLLAAVLMFLPCPGAYAATDGYYNVSVTTATWDSTGASRLKPATPDYDYAYGDEASVTYTLPWNLTFYGQTYTGITADVNGNIWLNATDSVYSFNLSATGRGPVISPWNNDLSSSFQGGVFIQHKTNPERVVIEWRTETYTEEGYSSPNNFEAVIYPDNSIRFDYKGFTTQAGDDAGSGISKGDGSASLNLTNLYGNAYNLAGQSFLFTPQALVSATVAKTGPGTGTVTSYPTGIMIRRLH